MVKKTCTHTPVIMLCSRGRQEANTRVPDFVFQGHTVTHALSSFTSASLHTCQYIRDTKDGGTGQPLCSAVKL